MHICIYAAKSQHDKKSNSAQNYGNIAFFGKNVEWMQHRKAKGEMERDGLLEIENLFRSFRAIYIKYNIDQGEEDGGAFQVGQLFLRRQEIPGSKVERYVLPTCLHYSLLTLFSIQRVTKCFYGWLQKRVLG